MHLPTTWRPDADEIRVFFFFVDACQPRGGVRGPGLSSLCLLYTQRRPQVPSTSPGHHPPPRRPSAPPTPRLSHTPHTIDGWSLVYFRVYDLLVRLVAGVATTTGSSRPLSSAPASHTALAALLPHKKDAESKLNIRVYSTGMVDNMMECLGSQLP